jgi:KH domain-containing protein
MTEKIYVKNARTVIQNKKLLESSLKVNLAIKGGIVTIEGEPEKEIIAFEVIESIELGFTVTQALDLKQEDFILEKIHIKSTISRKRNMSQVRARIIGTERRALSQVEYLTGCDIVLHDNTIGIIGHVEDVKRASYALRKLVSGSKHSNVYAFLEEQNAKEKAGFY